MFKNRTKLEEPLDPDIEGFPSFNLSEDYSDVSIGQFSSRNLDNGLEVARTRSEYKFPASMSDARTYYEYSIYGREVKNGKICPSSGEREKVPYSLFEREKNIGDLGSTFRFYLFIKNNSSIMLSIIMLPSLLLLYRYQQLFFRYYANEERTLSFYWRSLWDYNKKIMTLKNKEGVLELEYILYENAWAVGAAVFALLVLIYRRSHNYLRRVSEEDKDRKRRAEDFTVMILNAHTEFEEENIRKMLLILFKLYGFPAEYFQIAKINRALFINSPNMIIHQISDLRDKLQKLEKQIESAKMAQNPLRIAALEKEKITYLKKIEKLENKKEKITRTEPSSKQKERRENSLVFITFGTTLQRDIFLSLHGKLLVPVIKTKDKMSLVFPAPPVGNIEWRNAGYDSRSIICHRALAQLLASALAIGLIIVIFPVEVFIKQDLELIGPVLTVLFSKLLNKIREKISLLNRSIYIDMMAYSGVSYLMGIKQICTVFGITATMYLIHKDHPEIARFDILCKLMINLLAVKIFLVPLMSLVKPRDVIVWVRKRWTMLKYRKYQEKVPLLQKDLNRDFKRLDAPLVPIFTRIVYLAFISLSYIPTSPLICPLCLISIQIQSIVDRYLILRRYKKMPEILSFGKKYILMCQVRSIQIYIIITRWLGWAGVGAGFRWTPIEFIREAVLVVTVFWVKWSLSTPRKLARFYYSKEVSENGKFADFVLKLKNLAWGREKDDKGFYEGKNKDQELRKKVLEDTMLQIREGRFGERSWGEDPDELNQFGVKYQAVREMLDQKILELKEDDYYENCELELQEDYDRANPLTEYTAKQIFLKKKVMKREKEILGEDEIEMTLSLMSGEKDEQEDQNNQE